MYALKAVADVLAQVTSWLFFNWWAAVFADSQGWLPNWLKWFQTFDAPLDAGWRDSYKGYTAPTGPLSRWWQRTKWLYRNTAYGFSYWFLGEPFNPAEWKVVAFEKNDKHDLFRAEGPNGQFNLTYYGRWGTVKLGWKAWNYYNADTGEWKTTPWGPEWRVPLVFSVNPFRRK